MKVFIQLEDGTIFEGTSFGANIKTIGGSFVLHSAMIGYEEIMTDPSNQDRILIFTYPLIGGYGTNFEDLESDKPTIKALICRKAMDHVTNFRSEMDLDHFLKYFKIIGVENVDTRGLAKHLRQAGPLRGVISKRLLTPSQMEGYFEMEEGNLLERVSTKEIVEIKGAGPSVGVWDFGIKNSTLNFLSNLDLNITLYPAMVSYEQILKSNHQALFLSSGPGVAAHYFDIVNDIREMMGQIPIYGIGLGAQFLGLALGGQLNRLKGGHHETSHPVKDIKTGRVYMTSQNHEYGISQLPEEVEILYTSEIDSSIEGFAHKEKRVKGVFFDPQGSPGADDLQVDCFEFFKNL